MFSTSLKAKLRAPQEQPSDEEAAAFADQHGMYYDTDPTIAGKHARALLSRYGAAPQGGEDAEPVCYIGAGELQRLREEVPKTGAAIVAGVQRDSYTKLLYDRPQPAGRDAREVPDEP